MRSRPCLPIWSWTSDKTTDGTGYLAKPLSVAATSPGERPAEAAFHSESGVIR
jgi:hypothetical protein